MLRRGGGRSGGRPFRPELTFDLRGSCRHRDDGQDRLAGAPARVRLPELGDLRRPRFGLRLRALRRAAEGPTCGPAGSRRWCRSARTSSRSTRRSSSTLASGRRRGTSRASPTRSSTAARASCASGPTSSTEAQCAEAAEQAARRDLRLRPDRGAAVQPDVRDARRRGRGDRRERVPPTGDGTGDLHQLQERRAARPPQAAVRDRKVGKSFRNEITPGNFLFRALEFEQMEMEYFVPPARGGRVVPLLDRRALRVVHALRASRKPPARPRARRRGAVALLERHERPRVPLSRSAGRSSRGSRTAATSTSRQHTEHSGTKLEWVDAGTGERFVPHVIEPAVSIERIAARVPDRRVRRGGRRGATSERCFASTPRWHRSRPPCCR